MVGTARFELATSSTPRKRATKLRHVPMTYIGYQKHGYMSRVCKTNIKLVQYFFPVIDDEYI